MAEGEEGEGAGGGGGWREAAAREAEAHAAAAAVISLVMARVGAHEERARALARARRGAVAGALAQALDVVEMALCPREDHCVDQGPGLTRGNWDADLEPTAAPCDAWARGAVPTLRPNTAATTATEEPARMQAPSGVQDGHPTGASGVSGAGRGKEGEGRRDGDGEGGPSPRAGGRQAAGDAGQAGAESGAEAESAGGLLPGRTAPLGRATKRLTTSELELEQRLREEIEARKAQGEAARRAAQKDREEEESLATLQKELRGKDYGYDHGGKVVVFSRVDPDKLPAQSVGARAAVRVDGTLAAAEEAAGGAKKVGKRPVGKEAPAKGEPGTTARQKMEGHGPDFLQQVSETQPDITETLKVASGVTLREGGMVKSGPKHDSSFGGHMTKKDYLSMMGKGGQFEESFQADGEMDVGGDGEKGSEAGDEAARLRGEAGDGQSAARAPSPSAELPDWVADGVAIPAVAEPVARAESPDINLMLTAAADWGQNTIGGKMPDVPPLKLPKSAKKPVLTRKPRLY